MAAKKKVDTPHERRFSEKEVLDQIEFLQVDVVMHDTPMTIRFMSTTHPGDVRPMLQQLDPNVDFTARHTRGDNREYQIATVLGISSRRVKEWEFLELITDGQLISTTPHQAEQLVGNLQKLTLFSDDRIAYVASVVKEFRTVMLTGAEQFEVEYYINGDNKACLNKIMRPANA